VRIEAAVYNLRNRSFLKEIDFTEKELGHLLALSESLKHARYAGTEEPRLAGKEIALIFEKDSTRTRCAFEVAAHDQGAHVTYLGPSGSHLGTSESTADTAKVLGRMFDAIECRGFEPSDVEELAANAGVPVYNGLTNQWHPTQMLADFLTMHEASGKPYRAISYCFMGDGSENTARSLLVMGAIMGADVRICGPKELATPDDVRALAQERATSSGARLTLTDDLDEGLRGADFVYTDVWVSMGESADLWDERVRLLRPYQVDRAAMERTGNPDAKFMHCLPAFHDRKTTVGAQIMDRSGLDNGLEVTDDVFTSPASIVFDQAENRLHTIKAILVATLA